MWTLNRIVCPCNLIQGEENLSSEIHDLTWKRITLLLSGRVCLCGGVFWWLWFFFWLVWCFVFLAWHWFSLLPQQTWPLAASAKARSCLCLFQHGQNLRLTAVCKVMCSAADRKLHYLGPQLFILSRTVCLLGLCSNACNDFPALFNCISECLPHPSHARPPVCFLKGWKHIKIDAWCEMRAFTQAVL